MADALAKVKADLGKDAVILHTRSFKRGGVLGVGAKMVIEITASTDAAALDARERKALSGGSRVTQRRSGELVAAGRSGKGEASPLDDTFRTSQSLQMTEGKRRVPPIDAEPAFMRGHGGGLARERLASSDRDFSALAGGLRDEMNEIRSMVRELLARPAVGARSRHVASSSVGEQDAALPEEPAEFQVYYTRLLQNAVAEEVARDIMDVARARLADCRARIEAGIGDRLDRSILDQKVREKLEELVPAILMESIERLLPVPGPVEIDVEGVPKLVALVGPTGVGKTTTIAKLAAHFKLREGRRVGLITTDTYRIAAVDQLKAYAEIMNLGLEVVFSPEELPDAINRLSDCDLILMDTSGRSHRDSDRLRDLGAFLDAARRFTAGLRDERANGISGATDKSVEVHLLLSCTSNDHQLIEVAEKFSSLGIDRAAFTKLDEAVGLGVVLNVASRLNLQLSYLTTGQDVPDDIEVGHRRRIAQMLLDGCETADAGESAACMSKVNQLA